MTKNDLELEEIATTLYIRNFQFVMKDELIALLKALGRTFGASDELEKEPLALPVKSIVYLENSDQRGNHS